MQESISKNFIIPENIQHTPNPDAQLPPFVPPLFEHSSLEKDYQMLKISAPPFFLSFFPLELPTYVV